MKTKPAKSSKQTKPVGPTAIVDFDTATEAIKDAFGGDVLRVTFRDVPFRKLLELYSLSSNIALTRELSSVLVSGRWGSCSRTQDLEVFSMIGRDRILLAQILGEIVESVLVIKAEDAQSVAA